MEREMAAHHVRDLLDEAMERHLIIYGAVNRDFVVVETAAERLILKEARAVRLLKAMLSNSGPSPSEPEIDDRPSRRDGNEGREI